MTPLPPQFPGSVGFTPFGAGDVLVGNQTGAPVLYGAGSGCCAVRTMGASEKCSPNSAVWESIPGPNTWGALQFSVEDPSFYAYGYSRGDPAVSGQPAVVTDGFTAAAMGDLDCDGTRSEFALFGWVGPDTDGPAGTSAISKYNELE